MTSVVLDASALLAWLQEEPGAEQVEQTLSGSALSIINYAEIVQKCQAAQVPTQSLRHDLEVLGITLEPVTIEDAHTMATLWAHNQRLGLSLADRACLALATRLGRPAITADKIWKHARADCAVVVIC